MKKKYNFIFLMMVLIFFSAWSFCRPSEKKHDHTTMEGANPSDMSLNFLESNWQTESGNFVKIKDLTSKKNQVLAMVYLNCKVVCPRIISDMKYIHEKLGSKAKNSTEYTLVTIDPDRDSLATFAEFGKKYRLDLSRWHFLRGSKDDIRELAAVLGVKYMKLENEEFSHSNTITIINTSGEIVYQKKEVQNDMETTISVIENMASD